MERKRKVVYPKCLALSRLIKPKVRLATFFYSLYDEERKSGITYIAMKFSSDFRWLKGANSRILSFFPILL